MKSSAIFRVGLLLSVISIVVPQLASAASLYIDPALSQLNRGDSATMAVRLDVDEAAGECVNAADVILTYSEGIEPVDVSIGDSILRVWVEEPIIDRAARTVAFAGGIPNGYCGRIPGDPRLTNVLAEVVFQLPGFAVRSSDSSATISFAPETTVYLNDGFGTKATLATYPATINLGSGPGATIQNPWREEVAADRIPPEEFSISLQRDEKAFSQKYYIVFNTTDKQTGIARYEVMEEPLAQFASFQWGRADAPWIETNSPYVLQDQSLNSTIRVRAVDKAGNEYIATYVPDETMRTLSGAQITAIVGGAAFAVLLIVLGIVARVILKRRRAVPSAEDNMV
jgi:hypothetical protein